MYQKRHIQHIATFFLLMVFLFVYTDSAKAKKNCHVFTNNANQINFLTLKFLLKNADANLNQMSLEDFQGFNKAWNRQYINGTLMYFFKKNRNDLRPVYEDLSIRIEKKKLELRLGGPKNCEITKANFENQFEKFTAYVIAEAQKIYNGDDFQDLVDMINEHKTSVYQDLNLAIEPRQTQSQESQKTSQADEGKSNTGTTDKESIKREINILQDRMNHNRIMIYLAFGLGLLSLLLSLVILLINK